MRASYELVSDHWYVVLTCVGCKEPHILFPDLTDGKSKLTAKYRWQSPLCGHDGDYDGEFLERYQHKDGDNSEWW